MLETYGTLTLTSACLIVLYLCYNTTTFLQQFVNRRSLSQKHGCKPPQSHHPCGFLGLGLLGQIGKQIAEGRRLESLKSLYDNYGTTYLTHVLGQTTVNTIAPENLRMIYAIDFDDYGAEYARLPPSAPAVGRNVFTTDGHFWKRCRTQVNLIFTRAHVSDLSGFQVYFDKFMEKLPEDGRVFDINPLVETLFIDSALDFLFGIPLSSESPESKVEKMKFLRAFGGMLAGMGRRFGRGKLRLLLYRDPPFDQACKEVKQFSDKYVHRALESARIGKKSSERYIFVEEMAKEISDPVFIRDNLLAVFLAGHETTAIVLQNCIFLCSRHPEIWARLRQETLSADASQPVTFEVLKGLKYLGWVINETIRLYPPVVNSTRVALKDAVLPSGGGHDGKSPILVKRGWTTQTHPYSMNRNKEIYDRLEDFIPERWDNLRRGWDFLPFSGGSRVCPAQQHALTEASFAMFTLSRKFKEIQSCDDTPWTERIRLTAANKNGVKVSLITE